MKGKAVYGLAVIGAIAFAITSCGTNSFDGVIDDILGGASSSSIPSSSSELASSSSSVPLSSSSSLSDGSVSCLFRSYDYNMWFCRTDTQANCAKEVAMMHAEAYAGQAYIDIEYELVNSCEGYPEEWTETEPFVSIGKGCLITDYSDLDYRCQVISSEYKCSQFYQYIFSHHGHRYSYEPVDSCEGFSTSWELLKGCLIFYPSGEVNTCIDVPNKSYCQKALQEFTSGFTSEFLPNCDGYPRG